MKYKLVCIDIDGTLLNSSKRVSKGNKVALKKAFDKGVKIVITTGRIFNNAAYYSDLIGAKSAVIAANGGIIKEKDNDKVIYKNQISEDICKNILEIALKNKVSIHFHTANYIFNNSFLQSLLFRLVMTFGKPRNRKVKIVKVNSKKQWEEIFTKYKDDIIKAIIVDLNKSKLKKVRKDLEKLNDLEVLSSGRYNLEVNKKGISKGKAVKYLAEYYGIKREEVIAIGDNENDISMIEYAGLGVAMGNGIKELKEKADYITDSNNRNGVAKVIEKFILNS